MRRNQQMNHHRDDSINETSACRRHRTAVVVCGAVGLLLLCTDVCSAQLVRGGLISPILARRYGLERAWYTQVEIDRSQSRVQNVTMHVSNSKFHIVEKVNYDGGSQSFSERDLDRFGDPIGIEGAKKKAKKLIQELKDQGLEPVLETLKVPQVRLYVQTDGATVTAIDGETGRTLWSEMVGRRDHATLKPGASDSYVAVVNGSNLFVLDAETGGPVWDKRLGSAPGGGPAINEFRVFAPLINGKLEVYQIANPKRHPWIQQSSGRALIQPTVSPKTVSWATDRGTFYVAFANREFVRYRLQALDAITAKSTFSPTHLFVASTDGYVYCMQEYRGDVVWRFSAGEPISHSPIVIDGRVYVVSDRGGMYCVDAETGQEIWWTSNVRKFLSASDKKIYCLGRTGRIMILDRETGGRISTMPTEGLDLAITNWRTDRVYLGDRFGTIQCLHEPENKWPLIHVAQETDDPEDTPEIKQKEFDGGEKDPADPFEEAGGEGGADPFGGGADPFGGGGADPFGSGGDAGGGADPFGGGGGADPFGTDDKKDDAGANPFGGGAGDPFG